MTEGMELPGLLTAQPKEVAEAIFQAVKNRKNTVYVKWMGRYIMLIIKLIPEPIFKKIKL
jgi:short-subunit dehydrogenase